MNDVFFYGDIHGNVDILGRNINKNDNPDAIHIQVGDFGFGFFDVTDLDDLNDISETYKHRLMIIRGNHDSPEHIKKHQNYVEDGRIEIINNKKFMFVGGANSIYKQRWPDEELSEKEFDKILDKYEKEKPDVMVTHDCPSFASYQMFTLQGLAPYIPDAQSITKKYLSKMHLIHSPEQWFFGHWHHTVAMELNGTLFQCIGYNEYLKM